MRPLTSGVAIIVWLAGAIETRDYLRDIMHIIGLPELCVIAGVALIALR